MPTYEYVCDGCSYEFEVVQSFHEKPKKKCSECKKHKLRRKLFSPDCIMRINHTDVKTLGHLADRNTAKMGGYEVQEKRHEIEKKDPAKRKQYKPPKRPIWRPDKDKPDMSLASLTPAQKKTYIETGKKP